MPAVLELFRYDEDITPSRCVLPVHQSLANLTDLEDSGGFDVIPRNKNGIKISVHIIFGAEEV